ncbi:formate dehydrogenase accessory sulfurtransferase FdhD [Ammoniphilus sp. 3BR4]|uniref:formate dehydrogenase accessory sulfurtransferase FdhD n=1 Tax=Ammoniphilus sp. 3BR4 TaxID=3158265 RepID=UPI00346788EB
MGAPIVNQQKIIRFYNENLHEIEDEIAVEFPMTIVVDGEELATMVCTPSQLEDLVIGFLASEGLIRFTEEILSLSIDEKRGFAHVELKNKKTISKDFYSKRFIGSCCGKSRQFYLHNDARTAKTVMTQTPITVQQCFNLMKQMQERSIDFQATGGVHNAALCTPEEMIIERSDIGRHNALDKIYGYCLQHRISPKDKVIAFSGRISSEVLLKVAKIGAGIMLSKSAPTTLALELAHDLGITTVGFIRNSALNIYTHPHRIVEALSE